MKNLYLLTILVFVSLISTSVQATLPKMSPASVKPTPNTALAKTNSAMTSEVQKGTVEFFVLGKPSMLKIHGESSALSGNLSRIGDELTGELVMPLNSFATGMTTRDKHLKDKVFETSKFENAVLSITSLKVPAGNGEFKNLEFSGKLKLHGVEKEIKGTSQVTVGPQTTGFTAHLDIKLTDFQITPPEFLGMSIQDDVKIDAKGEAKAQ
ncbi:MAG: YceI family protein [Bdellovibrionales bacterium]|nr:YceI family protein [Oligoflexia bacterium]